jgi:hypothetical protein
VKFRNEAAGVDLAGTLNWPEGYKQGDSVPAVLFITGSGKQNRDEGLFGHKPFLVLSYALAKAGIASWFMMIVAQARQPAISILQMSLILRRMRLQDLHF